MTSDNCFYTKPDNTVPVYKFVKKSHIIADINIHNIMVTYPKSFIRMIPEDEAVTMTQYQRYHDYICSSDISTNFDKVLNMYNIFWELNKQYYITVGEYDKAAGGTGIAAIAGILDRKNKSLSCVLQDHFREIKNNTYSTQYIKSAILGELANELYYRIEWEESKMLDAIANFRFNNNGIDANTWIIKYINHENNSRDSWYKFMIKIIELVLDRLTLYANEETIANIKEINVKEFVIPLTNYEIYDEDRYDYLANVDLNKARILDGLKKIVENGVIVTTSKICDKYIKATYYKHIVNIHKSVNTDKFINDITPVSINNHVVKSKKDYPKRRQQMERYTVVNVDFSTMDSNGNKNKKTIIDLILEHDKNSGQNNQNVNNNVNMSDRRSSREKKRDEYMAGIMKSKASINNVKDKIKQKEDFEKKMCDIRGFDIPRHVDMTRHDPIDENKVFEFKHYFSFSTVLSMGKYYIQQSTYRNIMTYYEKCKEKGIMLQEYLCDLHNKVVIDDVKNKTNNLQKLFKGGKVNGDAFVRHIFTL